MSKAYLKKISFEEAVYTMKVGGKKREMRHFLDKDFNKKKLQKGICIETTEIVVGMEATISVGSDSYGMLVEKISPAGVIYCVYAQKKGKKWVPRKDEKTVKVKKNSLGHFQVIGPKPNWFVSFGEAKDYRDPSF